MSQPATPALNSAVSTGSSSSRSQLPGEHLIEVAVDLAALRNNLAALRAVAAPADVMTVIKADAYNHGLEPVLATLVAEGVRHFGAATFAEGKAVAALLEQLGATGQGADKAGARPTIFSWMWWLGEDLAAAWSAGITIGVPTLAHAEAIVAAATDLAAYDSQSGPTGGCPVILMADTGLSRSGIEPADWQAAIEILAGCPHIEVVGVASHLACADDPADATTDLQLQRFDAVIAMARGAGLAVTTNHIANTPAALTRADAKYQLIRPGIGLYGVDPVDSPAGATGGQRLELSPVMTLRARVIATRVVPAGEGVSYGLTWVASVPTRTALVAIGYADGIPRAASGRMEVGINGRRYPQIGRVCMDQIVVDLGPAVGVVGGENTTNPEGDCPVRSGDWAVIFGAGGPSVREFAEACGTSEYEVLTMAKGRRVNYRHEGLP